MANSHERKSYLQAGKGERGWVYLVYVCFVLCYLYVFYIIVQDYSATRMTNLKAQTRQQFTSYSTACLK